ncbi:hypothetical protein ACWENQ_44900 [Nonomuraea sp. NPDC004354]
MTDEDAPNPYTYEDIQRFVAALAAVASQQLLSTESELYERLMTVRVVAEDLEKQLAADRQTLTRVNWLEHHTRTLNRYAEDMAKRYEVDR